MAPRTRMPLLVVLPVLLAACSGGPGGDAADATTAVVTIDQGRFAPAELVVVAGTTVTFVNEDAGAHTATAAPAEELQYDSGTLASGSSYAQAFDGPGTYAYVCTLHPTMRGAIVVE